MGAVFAPVRWWDEFNAAWTTTLKDAGIAGEFKTSDCVNRRGEFQHWTDPAARVAVEDDLIGLINESRLGAIWVGIDLDAYRRTAEPKMAQQTPRNVTDPYFLAFAHLVRRLVEAQDLANDRTAAQEKLGLVFDAQRELSGRATQYVRALQKDPQYAAKLDGLTFDDSRRHPGLQVADLIAFEARRFLSRDEPRPQWRNLHARRLSNGQPLLWGDYWDSEALEFATALVADADMVDSP